MADSLLLSEMSLRDMIFMKAMMPELRLVSNREERMKRQGRVQNAHAHGHHGAKLLALVDSNVPNNLPRKDGKDDIHDARVDCPR